VKRLAHVLLPISAILMLASIGCSAETQSPTESTNNGNTNELSAQDTKEQVAPQGFDALGAHADGIEYNTHENSPQPDSREQVAPSDSREQVVPADTKEQVAPNTKEQAAPKANPGSREQVVASQFTTAEG